MLRKIMYGAALVLFLSACASTHTTQDTNAAYSEHQYSSHDVAIAWKSEKAPPNLRITGAVTNTRLDSPYVAFELSATVYDAGGNTLGKKIFAVDSGPLVGSQPFLMEIPVENDAMVHRVKFIYSYGRGDDRFSGMFESQP